jgi:hypothetical protein
LIHFPATGLAPVVQRLVHYSLFLSSENTMRQQFGLRHWIILISLSLTGGTAGAADIQPLSKCYSPARPTCDPCGSPFCPDDYCPKAFPKTACPSAVSPACYARKPLPCPPCPATAATCDTYVPKSFPKEACPFRPNSISADAGTKARWYERPLAVRRAY